MSPCRRLSSSRPAAVTLLLLGSFIMAGAAHGGVVTPVPQDQRGREDAERAGQHDANNMRTIFWNYGMVGDYPRDPGNVDLSVFHSVEVPKGSGMNYSDGVTPFVLAKITQVDGAQAFIMETGFRERQGTSPYFNRVMRFEPRPGYFQADPVFNPGRSPAMSNDPRTWPDFWPDRLDDFDDPGWSGSWNGYFGKQIVADQESYMVLDDDYYDAWNFFPDSRVKIGQDHPVADVSRANLNCFEIGCLRMVGFCEPEVKIAHDNIHPFISGVIRNDFLYQAFSLVKSCLAHVEIKQRQSDFQGFRIDNDSLLQGAFSLPEFSLDRKDLGKAEISSDLLPIDLQNFFKCGFSLKKLMVLVVNLAEKQEGINIVGLTV